MMMAKREEGGHVNNSRLESELDQHEREREGKRQRTINETLDEDNEWWSLPFRIISIEMRFFTRSPPPLARPAFFSP